MSKILVIGDTSQATANYAITLDTNASLVQVKNFEQACQSQRGVFFSGMGDLSFNQLKKLGLTCDVVHHANTKYNDKISENLTCILLNHISHFIPVINYVKPNIAHQLTHSVDRRYVGPTLWTFGCSHTAGIGLTDPENQCYGKLLADRLALPWQNVAKRGSSTMWSLTHLLHSDLQPEDIVVWGTTSPDRDRLAQDGTVIEMRAQNMTKYMMDYLTDEQLAFRHIFNVNCGLRYLRAKKIKFIFFSLLPNTDHDKYQTFNQKLEKEFSLHPEWCPTVDWYLDQGTDGEHPGPQTHQHLANLALSHLQLLDVVQKHL